MIGHPEQSVVMITQESVGMYEGDSHRKKIWSEQEKDMNDYDDDVRWHNTAIDY